MAMQPEKSSQFDPKQMKELAEKMVAEGKMPSPEKFFAALEKVRNKYAPQVMKDRQENKTTSSDEN